MIDQGLMMKNVALPKILHTMADVAVWQHTCAEYAYTQFMSKLDQDIYGKYRYQNKEYVTLSVYGPTQSGKTTLILHLIGIADECMKQVGSVLRGGQTSGKSATARVQRYVKSDDDAWHHSGRGMRCSPPLSDDEMRAVLGKIRDDMIKGDIHSIDCIDIFIPNKYFKQTIGDTNFPDLIINDLPGIQAGNKNEQLYADKIKEEYAQSSDLVLMVCSSNDMMALLQDASDDKSIALRGWQRNPGKYKIVITKVLSDDSTQIELKKNSNWKIEDFSNYILKQLQTDKEAERINLGIIFPVELGKISKERYKGDYEKAFEFQQQYWLKLNELIQNSNDPLYRIYYGFQVSSIAQESLKDEENNYQEKRGSLEKISQDIEQDLMRWQSDREYFTEVLNVMDQGSLYLKESIELLKSYINCRPSLERFLGEQADKNNEIIFFANKVLSFLIDLDNELCGEWLDYNELKDVSGMKREWGICDNRMKKIFHLYLDRMRNSFKYRMKNDQYVLEGEMGLIINKLNNYLMDTYFSGNNRRRDFDQLNQAVETQKRTILLIFCKEVLELLKEKKRSNDKYIRLIRYKMKNSDSSIADGNRHREENNEKIDILDKNFVAYKAMRNVDIEYGNNFTNEIKKQYQLFLDKQVGPCFWRATSHQKLTWLLLERLIKQDLVKIESKGKSNAE